MIWKQFQNHQARGDIISALLLASILLYVLSIAQVSMVRHFKTQIRKTGLIPGNLWTNYSMRECIETHTFCSQMTFHKKIMRQHC